MRKSLIAVLAVFSVCGVIAAPASARMTTCHREFTSGATLTNYAFDDVSCTFADAAGRHFWATSGVPRSMLVKGVRLRLKNTVERTSFIDWLYYGRSSYGREYWVAFVQVNVASSSPTVPGGPTIPYPGRGYPVVCADGWISHSGGIQGACSHHGGVG